MNDAQMKITLVFSEPVYGLQNRALTVKNASIKRVTGKDGDTQYHFVVAPKTDGTTALTLPEDAVTDAVGNGNRASPVFSLVVDSTGPTVTLRSFETARKTNARTIRIHAVFDEPVMGFTQGDLVVEGGTLLNFTGRSDAMTYVFDVKPKGGELRVSVPAGVTHDVIGNPNSASEFFVRQVERRRRFRR